MPIANAYNPNPTTVDGLLRQRQTRVDLGREQGLITEPEPVVKAPENPRFLGVEQTPDYEDKSFLRKVGEDAALLAYSIPVGLARVATGVVTNPIETVKELGGAFVQSVKDAVDPEYYKAHPLLGVVNLAGFVAPVAGAAKSAALKTGMNAAISTGIKEATVLGVSESVARTALSTGMREAKGLLLKKGVVGNAVWEAAKTGKLEIVTETVKNLLTKAGVAEDVALRVGTSMTDNLYTSFSRQTTKMKVLEGLAHPMDSASKLITGKVDPIRQAVFGSSSDTAVAKLYGANVVAKDPEGFVAIERWASAQIKERGFEDNAGNRQRIMQEWVDQNSQWASLTPEERVTHFKNYAEQDLIRLKIHEAVPNMDIVTVKSLPQNYVDSMVATLKEAPEGMPTEELIQLLDDNFGKDFSNYSADISKALVRNNTKDGLIAAVSKLGDARSAISFTKFSKEVQGLAAQLEKSGYRIGYAPKNKEVSFASDTFAGAAKVPAKEAIAVESTLSTRTALGNWIDKIGLSPSGTIEGAAEFAYRENFTQRVLTQLSNKYGNVVRVGKVSIPAEKLFEWIDKNKTLFQQSRIKSTLPLRTVFDVKADDLVRAGFSKTVAAEIESISKAALREVPVAVTGMGDAVTNYIRTLDKGYNSWMGNVYDNYLKVAYKGRYDLSPFFSAQQFLETKLQSAMFLKDARMIPGVKALAKIGDWTAEKLAKKVEGTAPYLRKILDEPPMEQVAAVRDEILGTLQKTMLDYTSSPDTIGIQGAAKGAYSSLKDKAQFEQSIRSRNFWYGRTGQSSVRMATTFNKALAEKFGMGLDDALSFTVEKGVKKYKNPQMVQLMRESTQAVFHYSPGTLTSPLMKTLNIVWFPLRFQAKTVQMTANWMKSLSPANKALVVNNWVHFANWAGTEEGIKWRRTNRNYLYNIFSYATAYEQIGQGIEAVTKGRLFGGNAGLIGGVPFGLMANIARELSIIPSDPDQFDPKTGRPFTKTTPRDIVSVASLSVALEQLVISIMPSTPFYSITGGMISGISPSKLTTPLIRSVIGSAREGIKKEMGQGGVPDKGRQRIDRDFMRVPSEYTRLAE